MPKTFRRPDSGSSRGRRSGSVSPLVPGRRLTPLQRRDRIIGASDRYIAPLPNLMQASHLDLQGSGSLPDLHRLGFP